VSFRSHWCKDKLISRWITTRFSRSTTSCPSLRITAPYQGFVESTSLLQDWCWSCKSTQYIELSTRSVADEPGDKLFECPPRIATGDPEGEPGLPHLERG
jgi:hypothetical protein